MAGAVTEDRVIEVAYEVMGAPFAWGLYANDCSSSALSVYLSLFGVDLRGFLPPYSNRDQAADLISRYGGLEALAQRIADKAGMTTCFHKGCIGYADDSLLIGVRPDLWLGKGLRGMRFVPRATVSWGCANYF